MTCEVERSYTHSQHKVTRVRGLGVEHVISTKNNEPLFLTIIRSLWQGGDIQECDRFYYKIIPYSGNLMSLNKQGLNHKSDL